LGTVKSHLAIDGQTLQNLEILGSDESEHASRFTLIGLLDHCSTPMGKENFNQLIILSFWTKLLSFFYFFKENVC
jgi:DNA mismatch repair ATPase MutS